MARIIERIPEPSMEEICSSCKELITLTTKIDCDGSPYPACGQCGDVIDNPWKGWKPTLEEPKPTNENLLTGRLLTRTYQISDLCLDEQHRYCQNEKCECYCH